MFLLEKTKKKISDKESEISNKEDELILAKAKEILASRLEGKTIVKEIYVPKKIVNIVVK